MQHSMSNRCEGVPSNPREGAPFALRKFEVEQFDPTKYTGTIFDLTGMFENRKFFELEGMLSNNINGWTVIICNRKDEKEVILCKDGNVEKPRHHQIKAEFYPNDMDLMNFCQKNGYQKYIAGLLECRVCSCEACVDHVGAKLFDFAKNFNFGKMGYFSNFDGEKCGLLVTLEYGIEHINANTGKLASSILEGIAHRRSNEIAQLKIFGINPFDNKLCAAPFLSQLAMGKIESMNNICGEDLKPKVKIHFEEEVFFSRMLTVNGWEQVNEKKKQPVALSGQLLGNAIDSYARKNGSAPEQYFDGKSTLPNAPRWTHAVI